MRHNGQKSKLDALTPEQREQLISWLCEERISYRLALQRVEKRFEVKSSTAAMSKFWSRICEPTLLRQAALKNAFLEVVVRVKQAGTILGETEFAVALGNVGFEKIDFDVSAKSPAKGGS